MNITKKFASLAVGAALASGIGIASATPAHAAGSVWDSVAACESSGNWSINTGNGYYGGLQFSESTWLAYGGGAYAHYASDATRAQQIAVAQKVLAAQGVNAWPVCGPKAGLTTSNGGASSSTATTTSASSTSSSSSTSSTSTSSTATKSSSSARRSVPTTAHRVAPKPTGTHRPTAHKGAPKPPPAHQGGHHARPPHAAHRPAPQPR